MVQIINFVPPLVLLFIEMSLGTFISPSSTVYQ